MMAEIIRFPGAPDLDALDRAGLRDWLDRVRREIDALDEEEPEDMMSEAYDAWADCHEMLEDLADELMDRLD